MTTKSGKQRCGKPSAPEWPVRAPSHHQTLMNRVIASLGGNVSHHVRKAVCNYYQNFIGKRDVELLSEVTKGLPMPRSGKPLMDQ